MRLVVLAEDFYPNTSGGAHTRWKFCQIASKKGYDISVFTPHISNTPKLEITDGVEIHRPFPAKIDSIPVYSSISIVTRLLFSVFLLVYLIAWTSRNDINAVHTASASLHWVGKVISVIYRLPLATFVGYTPSSSTNPDLSAQYIREQINFHLFMGDNIFVRNKNVRVKLEKKGYENVEIVKGILHTEQIKKVSETVKTNNVRSKFISESDDRLLVYVGRLVPVKNPIGALEVMSKLPESYKLLIAGSGPLQRELPTHAKKLEVANRIQLLGEVAHKKALELIAASDTLLVTSKYESHPAVVFEALALQTPVFSTPVGDLPELEHEKLHTSPIGLLPSDIREFSCCTDSRINKSVLKKYSIKSYTNNILDSFSHIQ